jgi:hypothetical protein
MTIDQKTLDKIKDTKQRKDILDKLKERLQDDDFLDKFKPKEVDPEPEKETPKRIPFDKFKEGERFPGMEPFYRFPKNFKDMTPLEKRKHYDRYLLLLEANKNKNAKGGEIKKFKRGGLAEATARLKAQELSAGGTVIKTKTVAMDKSPNSGLITQRGFGASRRT